MSEATSTLCELTPNQLNIWLGQAATPDLPVFNELGVFLIEGEIDRARFDRALQAVIDGTDAMRTIVNRDVAGPRVRILDQLIYRSAFIDMSGAASVDDTLATWAQQYVDTMLDLSVRVFDSTLVRLSPTRYAWALLEHHIATDATSTTLIYRRVSDWYERLATGNSPDPIHYPSFADYVERQVAFRSTSRYEKIERLWQDQLSNPPEPMVFYDGHTLSRAASPRRVRREVRLGAEHSRALRMFAARDAVRSISEGASLFSVFAATLFVLLYRISGARRRSIGVPWRNRPREAADTVGLLMEQDPFTVEVCDNDSFDSVIRKVHQEALAVKRRLPYAAGNPGGRYYDVTLNFVAASFGAFAGLPVEFHWYRPSWGEGSLLIQVHDLGGSGELKISFDFNAEVFAQQHRDAAIAQFMQLLDTSTADPGGSIATVEILPPIERQLLASWNNTRCEFPRESTVVDLFQAQAARQPDAIAATCGHESITYAELSQRAELLSARLWALGVRRGGTVGVCLNRSLNMLIGALGVMKSGAAYVPLDPHFPLERLEFMLDDSGASVLVTERSLAGTIALRADSVVELDTPANEATNILQDSIRGERSTASDLAYVLYTSGSTGQPKGVEVPHRTLTNFLCSMAERPGCGRDDVLLAVTTLSFDIAGLELFLPLITGGRVVIAGQLDTVDGRRLQELLTSTGVTIMQATPATWRLLIESGWSGTPGLKVLCGGEGLPKELAGQIVERCGELWNMYGPTETTIWSSAQQIIRDDEEVTIGRPIANTEFYIVDPNLQPTPIGIAGELLIGGDGLARGYRNRAELTAEKFIAHPFDTTPGARLYRTGDLARYRHDGQVVHLGRLDHQVKVRGFRIELGEVEAALTNHPSIQHAVVDARSDGRASTVLVAYCVTGNARMPTRKELQSFLRITLPDYMVPTLFVELHQMPLTPNGKVDRRALPAPDDIGLGHERTCQPARTPTERVLVAIWKDLLGVAEIDVRDDFFELGGHSLLALQMLNQVVNRLGVDIPLHRIFEASSLEAIAGFVDTGRQGDSVFVPTLTAIWCDLLDKRTVGLDDDFIELQGDHDLVDEMLLRTRKACGALAEGLSATEFRVNPTIRNLAAVLDRNRTTTSSLVVPLRRGGTTTPIFLVHAGGGYVFFYRALAAQLDHAGPVYGIRAEDPNDGGGRPFVNAKSIEDVATCYVEELMSIQANGPYLLGGACAGGLIAFEMARQLIARGEQLAGPIFLFDSLLCNNKYLTSDDVEALISVGAYEEPRPQALKRALARQIATAREAGWNNGIRLVVRSGLGRLARGLRRSAMPLIKYARSNGMDAPTRSGINVPKWKRYFNHLNREGRPS